MKNPAPYVCDECTEPKQQSSEWLLGLRDKTVTHDSSLDDGCAEKVVVTDAVVIVGWNVKLAQDSAVAHLCCIPCASKWLSKKLDERRAAQPQPKAQLNDPRYHE